VREEFRSLRSNLEVEGAAQDFDKRACGKAGWSIEEQNRNST
jgi:hypothetical protein